MNIPGNAQPRLVAARTRPITVASCSITPFANDAVFHSLWKRQRHLREYAPARLDSRVGHVGVGDTSPDYRLELPNSADADGQGRANAWKTYSSQRWKTNVRTIDHAMDKVAQLRGVYFDWQGQGKHDIGLIAEEVGRVVPEVVDYEANGTDATALAYDRLVALLVEAVKEQQARIDGLEQTVARNRQLEQRLDALERLIQQRQVPSIDR